jgi:hypothetical protein
MFGRVIGGDLAVELIVECICSITFDIARFDDFGDVSGFGINFAGLTAGDVS